MVEVRAKRWGLLLAAERWLAAQSRIEKLERMVVWAVKWSRWINRYTGGEVYDAIKFWDGSLDYLDSMDFDGTDAGLLAAVEKAMANASRRDET